MAKKATPSRTANAVPIPNWSFLLILSSHTIQSMTTIIATTLYHAIVNIAYSSSSLAISDSRAERMIPLIVSGMNADNSSSAPKNEHVEPRNKSSLPKFSFHALSSSYLRSLSRLSSKSDSFILQIYYIKAYYAILINAPHELYEDIIKPPHASSRGGIGRERAEM